MFQACSGLLITVNTTCKPHLDYSCRTWITYDITLFWVRDCRHICIALCGLIFACHTPTSCFYGQQHLLRKPFSLPHYCSSDLLRHNATTTLRPFEQQQTGSILVYFLLHQGSAVCAGHSFRRTGSAGLQFHIERCGCENKWSSLIPVKSGCNAL